MNKQNNTTIKLAVLTRMFPNIVQTYVLNHILFMKKAGFKILIVSVRDPKQNEIHPRVIEQKLAEETLYIDTEHGDFTGQILTAAKNSLSYLPAFLSILFSGIWWRHGFKYTIKSFINVRIITEHDINIMHSHSLFSSYDFLFLKEIFSIPLTTTFHGLVPKNVKMLEADRIKTVLDTGDAFFVNTRFAENQLLGLGCPQQKIHIIPQGTNTADFPFVPRKIEAQKQITILSVGRLSIEKGFHIAIKAIAKLNKSHPNIKYHIVGGGPEEEDLIKLIDELGLHDTCTIFGAISTEKLLAHYTGAHMFILPSIDFRDGSHTETQGVVLQEAQSTGLPIIASRTGGIPEIIKDGETGLLFDEENVEQLSTHIKTLIEDKQLYHKLHLQGRKDVEDNYSSDVICKKLLNVYQTLLAETGNN